MRPRLLLPALAAVAVSLTAVPAHAGSAAAPAFSARARAVTAAELGRSWHRGCPVAPAELRDLELRYWGFDRTAHVGHLVVHRDVVRATVSVFRQLYDARFPLRRMVVMAAYAGDDDRSTRDDDTAGFDCRYAVAPGPHHWSMHAYGHAIDVNPVENPYVLGGRVDPPSGRPYADRRRVRPGMAVPGGVLVRAFRAVGWGWGGRWSGSPDYQHFSTNGR